MDEGVRTGRTQVFPEPNRVDALNMPSPEEAHRELGMALYHEAARANAAEAALDRVRAVIYDDTGHEPHRCSHCGLLDGDWILVRLRAALHEGSPYENTEEQS